MNAESLLHERGRVAVVAHKDQFSREEKDALRESSDLVVMGPYFALLIDEEPVAYEPVHTPDPDHVCDDNDDCEFHEYQGPPVVDQSDEPTMEDLRGLTVARLQELADKEEVDLTGLKLKEDILGRLALHFGLDPAN